MSKPSERIKMIDFVADTPYSKAVKDELDTLHDRIEALELNAKVKANPEHFSSEPKQENKCICIGLGQSSLGYATGCQIHDPTLKQEPKFPFNQYAEKSYPCSNEVKETKCEHDFGFHWREFKRADVYKVESPTCPFCPKQENKKVCIGCDENDNSYYDDCPIHGKQENKKLAEILREAFDKQSSYFPDEQAKACIEAVERVIDESIISKITVDFLKEKLRKELL